MLDWIFEGIANWVASVMTQIMDAISGVFLDALGTDMTAMEEYFPFAVSAYTVIQIHSVGSAFSGGGMAVIPCVQRSPVRNRGAARSAGPRCNLCDPDWICKAHFQSRSGHCTSALYSAHGRDYGPGRLYICGNPADSYQWVGYHRICSHGGRTDFVDHFHDRIGMELL